MQKSKTSHRNKSTYDASQPSDHTEQTAMPAKSLPIADSRQHSTDATSLISRETIDDKTKIAEEAGATKGATTNNSGRENQTVATISGATSRIEATTKGETSRATTRIGASIRITPEDDQGHLAFKEAEERGTRPAIDDPEETTTETSGREEIQTSAEENHRQDHPEDAEG